MQNLSTQQKDQLLEADFFMRRYLQPRLKQKYEIILPLLAVITLWIGFLFQSLLDTPSYKTKHLIKILKKFY